ncbi:MAG: glycosyltransferase family 2 protein [Phycisphaerales bacterium JB043]
MPTRDRQLVLRDTIEHLGKLDLRGCQAELIVVDNASRERVIVPRKLANGMSVEVVRLEENRGAAGRNVGVERARGDWVVMLDDDSWLVDLGVMDVLGDVGEDVAAIGAEIFLPDGSRERGGLPEVFIGCGAAIRRDAFLNAGGYDERLGYYVEEYDLCARLLLDGMRVAHDGRFRVRHAKSTQGRNFSGIARRLVRNNAWVMMRYAPRGERVGHVWETITRYGRIALNEGASIGYARGVAELVWSLWRQPRRPMSRELWDRFTGLAHARASLARDTRIKPGTRAMVAHEGKHVRLIERALVELGVVLTDPSEDPEVVVVGTLSPGPMLDAKEALHDEPRPVIVPWELPNASEKGERESSTIAA